MGKPAGHPLRRLATFLAYRYGIESPDEPVGEWSGDEKLYLVKRTDSGKLVYGHENLGRHFVADDPSKTEGRLE